MNFSGFCDASRTLLATRRTVKKRAMVNDTEYKRYVRRRGFWCTLKGKMGRRRNN